jgi:hypothetical protein
MGEVVEEIVPFGKQPHNYGKSPFLWVILWVQFLWVKSPCFLQFDGKSPCFGKNYGKSPFLWVKQLFDWAIFKSFLYVYQRVYVLLKTWT